MDPASDGKQSVHFEVDRDNVVLSVKPRESAEDAALRRANQRLLFRTVLFSVVVLVFGTLITIFVYSSSSERVSLATQIVIATMTGFVGYLIQKNKD
jgi:hypothetical protein